LPERTSAYHGANGQLCGLPIMNMNILRKNFFNQESKGDYSLDNRRGIHDC